MSKIELYKGDCLKVMDKLIEEGVKVDMVFVDLPYSIPNKRTTANKWDLPINLEAMWDRIRKITKEDSPIIMTATNPFSSYLVMSNFSEFKYEWIWEKSNGSNFVHTKYQPLKVHEHILVFGRSATTYTKKGKSLKYNPQKTQGKPYVAKRSGKMTSNLATGKNQELTSTVCKDGLRHPRTVQFFKQERGFHPTQKPVTLLEYLVKTYSDEGEVVLDFTMGSGTTGVSCKNLGRDFIGIELDDKYFDIAKERIEGKYDKD